MAKLFMKASNLLRKRKGEINTIAMLVLISVFLLVTYPAWKGMMNDLLTSVGTWLTGQTSAIFK